ncbi:MAG: hypothetical protein KDK50_06730 [Chlamydiia bacterium]|nr:hypothetical protein [Chlamydiia bacterium]MCP5491769.1 hypothetical protein [Chlamydiales bacterium]
MSLPILVKLLKSKIEKNPAWHAYKQERLALERAIMLQVRSEQEPTYRGCRRFRPYTEGTSS